MNGRPRRGCAEISAFARLRPRSRNWAKSVSSTCLRDPKRMRAAGEQILDTDLALGYRICTRSSSQWDIQLRGRDAGGIILRVRRLP